MHWQEIVKQKRAQRENAIPKEWVIAKVDESQTSVMNVIKDSSILTEEEKNIVENYDATGLAEAIAAGKFTAVEITTAYCKAASIAQQLTNVLTEIFFDKALIRAKQLDDYFARTGQTVGPLHGVPVSIKDYMDLIDVDTTVDMAGAVFYVKTQNPQTLMAIDGDNNVFGPTLNPYNRELTSGGSSSGEGGLLGLHASPLGVGSDIGGSVRAPAGFCGVYGFKPSTDRLPLTGCLLNYHGQENVKGTMGPMGRSARDMELFMKVVIDDEPWLYDDPNLLPIPWRSVELKPETKLTIGILKHDGVVHPHPPIARALQFATKALKEAGHDVIEYEPYRHKEAWDLLYSLYFPDGGLSVYKALALSGEPMCEVPSKFIGQSDAVRTRSIVEHFENVDKKTTFQINTLEHLNKTKEKTRSGKPVDIILAPVSGGIAFPHKYIPWWGYTSYWNLQDWPGFTFPTQLKADKTIDTPFQNFESFGDEDTSNNNIYDPEIYHGMPIPLQVVGRRWHDEYVCAATRLIEEVLKNSA